MSYIHHKTSNLFNHLLHSVLLSMEQTSVDISLSPSLKYSLCNYLQVMHKCTLLYALNLGCTLMSTGSLFHAEQDREKYVVLVNG